MVIYKPIHYKTHIRAETVQKLSQLEGDSKEHLSFVLILTMTLWSLKDLESEITLLAVTHKH